MSSRLRPESIVLLFGPQDHSLNEESVAQLRSTLLEKPELSYLCDTISELSWYWEIISKTFPKLQSIAGAKLLEELNIWLTTGKFTPKSFPLPNILLTPLSVILQLTQYSRYIELMQAKFGHRDDLYAAFNQNVETVGFCTGLLTALAVSSSANNTELQKHGATAVRLAMIIGALVDAQDAASDEFISFSAAWNTPESGTEMSRILERFPEAYVSVLFDERRYTLTTSKRTASSLLLELRAASVIVSEFGLQGRFHNECYHGDVELLLQFCKSQPAFQLPDASRLILPTRSNSGGDYITGVELHEVAVRSILLEQSNWYQTFSTVYTSRLIDNKSLVIYFSQNMCIPPKFMRKLGQRLIHVANLDLGKYQLPSVGSEPKTGLNYNEASSENHIAVVGMSLKVAGANDLEEFWGLLSEGKSQHREVTGDRFTFDSAWREKDPKRKWYGNFVTDHDTFDHKFFKKSPREMASTDPQQRLMLQAAYQAVEQSGYFRLADQDKHIGCYVGVGTVDYERNIACHPANAFSATGNLKSFVAGKISHYFGWTGPGLTIDTACSASAVAVHQACKAILSGECTAALAGGAMIITSPEWFQNLAGAAFLSPTGACKPFDAKADGYCRGEGVGAVFLKKMTSAIADGDQILGVIASTAVYQNQNCTPITVPNAVSLSGLFQNVVRQAGLEPKQVSVVEAHGTGTPVGDPAEYESVLRVFGGPVRSDPLSLGSVKGLVGHTECASGIVALIKTLLMVQEAAIPPQASFNTINPSIKALPSDKIEIATSLKPWKTDFRAALINNYGASGSNASMVVTQAPQWNSMAVHNSVFKKHPFWFCGYDDQSLRRYATSLRQFLGRKRLSTKNISIANLSFNVNRQSNRSLARALVFNCNSILDLEEKLTAFEDGNKSVSSISLQPPRPIVLCFGGQISKFVGLDRQVYDSVKILRSHLDKCNVVCKSLGLDGIYPEIFQRTAIEDTIKLQTILFAMQYACAKSWIDCGIPVAAIVGHSFGELTALCISGVLSITDAMKMIASRARIIRDSWGTEKGSMLAVEAKLEDVQSLLADSSKACGGKPAATIACYNGPTTFTLAGSVKAIDAVIETIANNSSYASSMKTKKLNVTNAFHSILVNPLMASLEEVSQNLVFGEPTIPLERATEFESTERLTPKFVAEHMRNPVYFNHAVQRLSKRYPSAIWLEAGSNSTITKMASRVLGSPNGSHFQAVNITSENSSQLFTEATTDLWKQGVNVAFWPHHSSQTYDYAALILPPYQFEKSRHWLDLKKPQLAIAGPIVSAQTQEELPKGLSTFIGYQDKKERSARFRINTMTKKFEQYISGHTIAQAAPLCPSTLQLDIAIEALLKLRPDFATLNLDPQLQGLENHAPLCIDATRDVWLDVETKDPNSYSWNWKMVSNAIHGSSATILHVSGRLTFCSADDPQLQRDFERYERLIGHQRCLRLLDGGDSDDVIQGRNIYKAFSEIVDYGELYRGVQKIVGKGNESAGRVVMAYAKETWLDTPLADSFCQVAGIYVNLMTDKDDKDIFISNKIEQWIRSPKLRPGDSRPEKWDIFANHHRISQTEFVSDVFIFDSRSGVLVEMILGIGYQRVSRASLGKMLSRLTPGGKTPTTVATSKVEAPSTAISPAPIISPKQAKPSRPKSTKPKQPDISESVRNLLANVSGLEPHEIKDDTGLPDIGIDSLMGMELAREIETVFKCTLDTEQLNDVIDFKSLIKCIQLALGPTKDDLNDEGDESAEDDEESAYQSGSATQGELTPTSSTESNITEFLAEQLGIAESDIELDALLSDLGVDSLLSTELRTDIATKFGVEIPEDVAIEELTVKQLDGKINGQRVSSTPALSKSVEQKPSGHSITETHNIPISTPQSGLNIPIATILEAFGESKRVTDQFISDYKFGGYADNVLPKQTELCVAHIVEAFEKLGCSLATAKPGEKLERIKYLPKHERFVELLYNILEREAHLIDMDGAEITRTAILPPSKSADGILQDLINNFPDHANDHKLTYLTGSKLAECLSGKSDGIKLIFGSAEGRDLVSGLYGRSPINMAFLKQMEDFIKRLVSKLPMHEGPIKILEMGAGTGGTTAGMVVLLASLNAPVEYTFTDISPSLVAAARKRFKQYPFMKFAVHDIEKPPAAELLHSQHIVIANNCVHATHSLTNSTKHIHSVLRPDGFLMMVEMTSTLHWVDIIFGLLEGWWLFDDGRRHAVTHQSLWETSMQSVGYGHVDWTEGNRPESNLQRIIIGLASGPRYDHLPKSPKPPQSRTATDCGPRQAAVDNYVKSYTQGFTMPVLLTSTNSNLLGASDQCVLLTGATGSLGSHLVAHFAKMTEIKTVICLNRRSSTEPAVRQREAIESRGISLSKEALSKLKMFETDTAKPMLGLENSDYQDLVNEVTHITHNAWPMSIKRPVKGFESQFQVMQNLIKLASEISGRRPQGYKVSFQFISSIATVGYYPLWSGKSLVPEERMTVESVLPSGYSDAKLVCEKMLDETLHKYPDLFRPMAVRIGQISGSSTSGYWNPVEHFSFLVKSSQTLKVLPGFEDKLSWCPVDSVAATLADLLISDTIPYPIYHIENPVRQPWKDIIPVLADALDIPRSGIIPLDEWINRVRHFPGSEKDNPAAKLIDFFDSHFIRMSCGGLVLDTARTREHSKTLANQGPVSSDLARQYVRAWENSGFLNKTSVNQKVPMEEDQPLEIAIVGGGIIGLALALGLQKRNISFKIYERAQAFREIGAGIGFTPNAERAMKVVDPAIHAAFKKVAAQNLSDWFYWVDGYNSNSSDPNDTSEKPLFQIDCGERGFEGCHRAQFIEELLKLVPEEHLNVNKHLDTVVDRGNGHRLLLKFRDGTTGEADAIIGCDGIKSRVRQLILGEENPASYPGYSHKYAFRGLVPMEKAKAALGDFKTSNRVMHLGKDAHALTFPVAMGTLLNVVAFVSDPKEWSYEDKFTAPAEKSEAIEAFSNFGPAIQAIMNLLNDKLDKWAVFDTYDHPAPTYFSGRICIAGDAAHASAPHHGAGAGSGIEDAAVLAEVLAAAASTTVGESKSKAERLHAAFATYDAVRRERSQWLVDSSRIIAEMYEWQVPHVGQDAKKCEHEAYWRAHKIWDYDIDEMMQETDKEYKRQLKM